MSYKKNAVSYGIWALYLMVIGVVLSFLGMVIGNQDSRIPYAALGLLALSFGLLFLIYFLGKKIVDSVHVRKLASQKAALLEGLLVVLFLVAGIVLRVAMIGGAGEEAAYYEVSKVTENQIQLQLVQGSIYYYLYLLNGLFRLVGNKWMAGVVLQLVLQLIGAVIAYFAVRRLSGRGPALVSLLFLMAAPCSIKAGMTYSPKMLYFCLYAAILWVIAKYLWKSTVPGGKVLTWILAVLCGALVAFAGYTDVTGFTLVIPLCGLLVLNREEKGSLKWGAQFVLALMAMAGVFCLLVLLDSSMSGTTFEKVLGAWSVTYGFKGVDYAFFFHESGYETVILLVLMSLGIFTFMRRKDGEIFSNWIMMMLAIVVLRILGFTTPNMSGSYQMFFAMTGLAGVALCELFVRDEDKKAEAEGVPEAVVVDLDAHEIPEGAGEETISHKEPVSTAVPEAGPEQSSPGESGSTAFPAAGSQTVPTAMPREKAAEPEPAETKQEEAPKQVQFIENPLPLPKKHVKKTMDYPMQPEDSQMHYDIEVDPKDDFDF